MVALGSVSAECALSLTLAYPLTVTLDVRFGLISDRQMTDYQSVLLLGDGEMVFGGSAADGFMFQEFRGNHFDGFPCRFIAEQVLRFVEHAVNEFGRLPGIA